jgi:hypothetical protein
MKITLRNDFHNTGTTLNAKEVAGGSYYLSRSQVRKARRDLCGVAGCTCGGYIGQRGEQPQRFDIQPLEDGGARLIAE